MEEKKAFPVGGVFDISGLETINFNECTNLRHINVYHIKDNNRTIKNIFLEKTLIPEHEINILKENIPYVKEP